jgi:hypothetical protein
MYRRYRYRRAGRLSVRNVSSFLSSSLHFPGFRYSPDALSCLSNMHLYTISPLKPACLGRRPFRRCRGRSRWIEEESVLLLLADSTTRQAGLSFLGSDNTTPSLVRQTNTPAHPTQGISAYAHKGDTEPLCFAGLLGPHLPI